MKDDTMPADTISKILPLTKEQVNALILRLEEKKLTEEDILILRKFLRHRTVRRLIFIYKTLLKISSRLKDFLSLRGFLCLLKRKSQK
jgi:hypothetical protein